MDEQRYVQLVLKKRDLQAELAAIQPELDDLAHGILADWDREQIASKKLIFDGVGRYTLYTSRRIFAKQEFVNLAEVPIELHMLSSQKAATMLGNYIEADDKEGLAQLEHLGITPVEKIQLHVRKA